MSYLFTLLFRIFGIYNFALSRGSIEGVILRSRGLLWGFPWGGGGVGVPLDVIFGGPLEMVLIAGSKSSLGS